jgi:hypothetical protein
MLHLLGIDHRRLTYRFGGRDMRLTDVHGEVVRDFLVIPWSGCSPAEPASVSPGKQGYHTPVGQQANRGQP